MHDPIEVFCDAYGVCYCSTRERLVNAGIATSAMFPAAREKLRHNGGKRMPHEPLWSVQRYKDRRYRVRWGLCVEAQSPDC